MDRIFLELLVTRALEGFESQKSVDEIVDEFVKDEIHADYDDFGSTFEESAYKASIRDSMYQELYDEFVTKEKRKVLKSLRYAAANRIEAEEEQILANYKLKLDDDLEMLASGAGGHPDEELILEYSPLLTYAINQVSTKFYI